MVKYLITIIQLSAITDHPTDLFCIAETWLQQDEYVHINESTLPTHLDFHIPCTIG